MRQLPISFLAFACVLFFVLLLKTGLTQASPEPLTETKILDGLTRGAISPGRMATLVEQRGVDFTLTSEIEKELRNAGADDALIQVISRAKVQQKAALVIDADADCIVTVNGTSFEMKAGEEKVVAAAVGENVVRAMSKQDASKVWRKVVQVQASEQKAVLIELGAQAEKTNPAAGKTKVNPKDGMTYVWIPPGTFQMGCSPGDTQCFDNEKPAHQVTLTKGFWMTETEVTRGAYRKYEASKQSQNAKTARPPEGSRPGDDLMPELGIPWIIALDYCNKAGGTLPTEAEWEYAARGGTTGPYYGDPDSIAWDLAKVKMQPVRGKAPNAFGIYDMIGNAWEFVLDQYEDYRSAPEVDPRGPQKPMQIDSRLPNYGPPMVVRGLSASGGPAGLSRVSTRATVKGAMSVLPLLGFRCALHDEPLGGISAIIPSPPSSSGPAAGMTLNHINAPESGVNAITESENAKSSSSTTASIVPVDSPVARFRVSRALHGMMRRHGTGWLIIQTASIQYLADKNDQNNLDFAFGDIKETKSRVGALWGPGAFHIKLKNGQTYVFGAIEVSDKSQWFIDPADIIKAINKAMGK